jgi:hypothetical protein
MTRLREFSSDDFYGVRISEDAVLGLRCEIRVNIRRGQPYSQIVFLDDEGIKWKIVPVQFEKKPGREYGRPIRLQLYHRHSVDQTGFQEHGQADRGTTEGLRRLVEYIRKHEAYARELWG